MKENTKILYESLKEVINIIEQDLEDAESCIDEHANYTDELFEFKQKYYNFKKAQGFVIDDVKFIINKNRNS